MGFAKRPALGLLIGGGLALTLPTPAAALLELRFVNPPALPTLPTITLNARPQTLTTQMTGFSVEDGRLTHPGWNITAQGQTGAGKSSVFAQYCPKSKCGTSGEGYVAAGFTLPADSLTLNTTGASFSGGIGTAPTFTCSIPCALDSASAMKIASEGESLAEVGTWTAGGFSATSLALATATTLRVLPNEEVYRVNILWTLSSGP